MASVVGTYARAFADVVVERKLDYGRSIQELQDLEVLLNESDALRRVLDNPSIPIEQKHSVIDAVARQTRISGEVRNFIAVITDRHRLSLFADIVKHVEKELNDRLGFADAEVTSARNLSDVEKRLLESEIARMSGRSVRSRYRQDSSLLGGAVVRVGSTIYDGSVKGQLERIREQLVEG
jgi:F-type H+-transporting ATPase subunit delta